ncbi:Ribosomal-protein-S18p-alanine acetyltransferase [Methanosarcina barkeri str. Wiesmoor]|uniref:Ribosomal-protein-S18p-alanine acetyltransferase n=3 Tax=Methanosarcina barkeri TaxID=2208 RepID=A0A0E3QPB3_METBA|nr:Ribosomal-protein-S18p-alanine acetyltransferase [Methanosarcina barkeri str. Wiesmoor]
MGLTKIQVTLNVYVTSFERLMKDIITNLFIRKWVQIEKKNVVSVEDSMLPEIIRIQAEGFGTKSRNGVRRYSKRMKKIFYVTKSYDQVVGYCIYYLKPVLSLKGFMKKSVIYSISIDKNFRRKHYGENLLRESIKEMRLNGISSIFLYVNAKNLPAIRLYEKMGFRKIKEIKDICGLKETCYEMELRIL